MWDYIKLNRQRSVLVRSVKITFPERFGWCVYDARNVSTDNIIPLHSILFTFRVHRGFGDLWAESRESRDITIRTPASQSYLVPSNLSVWRRILFCLPPRRSEWNCTPIVPSTSPSFVFLQLFILRTIKGSNCKTQMILKLIVRHLISFHALLFTKYCFSLAFS